MTLEFNGTPILLWNLSLMREEPDLQRRRKSQKVSDLLSWPLYRTCVFKTGGTSLARREARNKCYLFYYFKNAVIVFAYTLFQFVVFVMNSCGTRKPPKKWKDQKQFGCKRLLLIVEDYMQDRSHAGLQM